MARQLPTITQLDQAAIWDVVLANRGLAHKVAIRYRGRGLEYDDLMSESLFGLYRAVELYDPETRIQFSTYATHWIRQAIGTAIVNAGGMIRVPKGAHQRATAYRKSGGTLGDLPTVTRGVVAAATAAKRPMYSLDAIRARADSGVDPPSPAADAGLDDDEREQVELAVAALTPAQRKIVNRVFYRGERQTDLARRLGISPQCVGEHRQRAINRLRDHLTRNPHAAMARVDR